jgi:hypothetical protein
MGEGRVRGSCVPAAGSLLIRQNDFAAASIILRFQSFDRRQEARFRLFAQGVHSSSWLRRFSRFRRFRRFRRIRRFGGT